MFLCNDFGFFVFFFAPDLFSLIVVCLFFLSHALISCTCVCFVCFYYFGLCDFLGRFFFLFGMVLSFYLIIFSCFCFFLFV